MLYLLGPLMGRKSKVLYEGGGALPWFIHNRIKNYRVSPHCLSILVGTLLIGAVFWKGASSCFTARESRWPERQGMMGILCFSFPPSHLLRENTLLCLLNALAHFWHFWSQLCGFFSIHPAVLRFSDTRWASFS